MRIIHRIIITILLYDLPRTIIPVCMRLGSNMRNSCLAQSLINKGYPVKIIYMLSAKLLINSKHHFDHFRIHPYVNTVLLDCQMLFQPSPERLVQFNMVKNENRDRGDIVFSDIKATYAFRSVHNRKLIKLNSNNVYMSDKYIYVSKLMSNVLFFDLLKKVLCIDNIQVIQPAFDTQICQV